jgi:hypothetical protein
MSNIKAQISNKLHTLFNVRPEIADHRPDQGHSVFKTTGVAKAMSRIAKMRKSRR